MEKRFITLQETSEYLGLNLTMVYRLSSENRLPGKVKFGHKSVRVDRHELDRTLEKMVRGGGDG